MGDSKLSLHSKSDENLRNINDKMHPFDCPFVKVSFHTKGADNLEEVSEEWHSFDCPDFWKHSMEQQISGQTLPEHRLDNIPFDELREDDFTTNVDIQPSIEKREKDSDSLKEMFPLNWKECREERCPAETQKESKDVSSEKIQSARVLRNLKSLNKKMRKQTSLKTQELISESARQSLLNNIELSSYSADYLEDKSLRKNSWSKSKFRSSFSQIASEVLESHKDDMEENSIASFVTQPSTHCDSSVESKRLIGNFWHYNPEREVGHQSKRSTPGMMYTVFFDS